MLMTVIIFTILIVLLTILPLSRVTHWTIRILDFPRLQILSISIILLIVILLFTDLQKPITWLLISLTTLCLSWHLWWILPYTFLWKKEVISCKNNRENTLSIITSNVLTPNKNAEALIQLVKNHQPDILITLESDLWWEQQLSVLESDMPFTIKCPLDNLYGMHLYSKLPLHDSEISFLVEKDVPSIHVCIEMMTGQQVRAHFLHPSPPSPTENSKSSERDAELIIVGKSAAKSKLPTIVAGDLNDVAWSSTTQLFRKISGLLDPRVGRGIFNTFHVSYPFLRWPLDHLFHSKHFTLCSIKRLPSIGSDHFPLFTVLALNSEFNSQQEGLQKNSDDVDRSEVISQEKNVSEKDVPHPGE